MRLHITAAVVVLGAGAQLAFPGRTSAQALLRSSRVVAAMPARYSEPLCELRGNHYKTTDALLILRDALMTDSTEADKRVQQLDKARARLVSAIVENNQGKSSTAWYTLAQVYLYQGDVIGADSALRFTQAIAPKCAQPIEALRYTLWAPLVNAGAEFSRAGANDSALALFREAAAILPDKPEPIMGAGVVFANTGHTDSAIVYFERAATTAERANMVQERNQATRNLGAMLQKAERHQEAVAALEEYLGWVPDDTDAKRALAASYRAAGRKDDARALEGDVVKNPADTVATPDDLMRNAVNLYEAQQYAAAAQAFERALVAAPYSRDAVFGLTASYQALEDSTRLVGAAQKLVGIEPLNPDALRLLAAGYRRAKRIDQAVEIAKQLIGLQTGVAIVGFTTGADSATLNVAATGRAAQTAAGKPVPPAAIDLVFEFVDPSGSVVASLDAQLPALAPKETLSLTVHAQGKGIVGWRYRRKAM